MGITINNNMMAYNTSRHLGNSYSQLARNVERLSSGLRINSAKDDPAGLAIREIMRSDIATLRQGIRNASDGISLLQTAEGAMAIIDEKLIRMKELAEQAATGTYTTVQRDIINSEYQAMAAEIDRIANATQFNGVKLLDGSVGDAHNGKGLKIHFGLGNSEAEDYYFVKISDLRATSSTGLRVAGDAKNDVWSTLAYSGTTNGAGCCGGGIDSMHKPVEGWRAGDVFAYGYNWDWNAGSEEELTNGRYLAGAYQADSTPTLEELVNMVNRGSQARVRVDFQSGLTLDDMLFASLPNPAYSAASDTMDDFGNLKMTSAKQIFSDGTSAIVWSDNPDYDRYHDTMDDNGVLKKIPAYDSSGSAQRFCIGDEVYYIGNSALAKEGVNVADKTFISLSGAAAATVAGIDGLGNAGSALAAHVLVQAINSNPDSAYWARVEDNPYKPGYKSIYIFCKVGGEKTSLEACDDQMGNLRGDATVADQVTWYNDEKDTANDTGTLFNNGGKMWGTIKAVPTGYGTWGIQLDGKDVGAGRDLWILNAGSGATAELLTGEAGYGGIGFGYNGSGLAATNLRGLDRGTFVELQNASDGDWNGSHLRTQSCAQEALDALSEAIQQKDKIRASLGSYLNRLENTIANLEIYAENLQAAESRISDVDIATEMTQFVKNQVLTQVGVSMLSQANSLPQMALSLLNG